MQILPFSADWLPDAHALNPQFVFDEDHTDGLVAVDAAGTLHGFALPTVQTAPDGHRAGWLRYAVSSAAAIAPLYTAIAKNWVAERIVQHVVMCAADRDDQLQTWFHLGFGIQQTHARLPLSDAPFAVSVPDGITIRQAHADDTDRAILRGFSNLIMDANRQAPVFAVIPAEHQATIESGYASLPDDPDANIWLAFEGDQAVAFAVFFPEIESDIYPENAYGLNVAGTLPQARGRGIQKALVAQGIVYARQQEYATLVTDWRTANAAASGAWLAMGFRAVTYRLMRQLDPRLLP